MLTDYTPRDGETVHLRPGNRWGLPAGRYQLREWRTGSFPGKPLGSWNLQPLDGPMIPAQHIRAADLATEFAALNLTPIPADQLAREAQEIRLRLAAPLRGHRAGPMQRQHDCSGLALFQAANEPSLF